MGNYTVALGYIKAQNNEDHKIVYEWEVSKKRWDYCMGYILKDYIKWIFTGRSLRSGIFWGFILLLLYIIVSYNFVEILEVLPFAIIITFILTSIPVIIQYKKLYYPEQYKFFIDNYGIFNGDTYSYLKNTDDPRFKFIDKKYILSGDFIGYSVCLSYKLYENENKFEIETVYFVSFSNFVLSPPWYTRRFFSCYMFNDEDKKILFEIIKDWQESNKIGPFEYSDKLILENYLKKINIQ